MRLFLCQSRNIYGEIFVADYDYIKIKLQMTNWSVKFLSYWNSRESVSHLLHFISKEISPLC